MKGRAWCAKSVRLAASSSDRTSCKRRNPTAQGGYGPLLTLQTLAGNVVRADGVAPLAGGRHTAYRAQVEESTSGNLTWRRYPSPQQAILDESRLKAWWKWEEAA
eukprot:4906350-Amphidinium_carterae.1